MLDKTKLTVKDLFKILPFDEADRAELMEKFDAMSPARKLEIQELCWASFHEYKEALQNIRYQELLQEVQDGKRKMETDFNVLAYDAAWRDIEDAYAGKHEDVAQMEAIRSKLQSLLNPPKPNQ